MIRRIKNPISILLSLIMVFSVFAIVPLSASAEVGDFVPESEYLTFTAEEAGSSVTLRVSSCDILQYDLNGTGLNDYSPGTLITLNNVGDYVRFRGTGTKFNSSNHVSIGGKVACSGNVMSLRLDYDGKSQGLSYICFSNMFYGCAGLITAPKLPETTLVEGCYASMFSGCTNLTVAPELPATALAPSCYSSMFVDCTSLTTAPELPATTLAPSCYERMFYGCGRLTAAPELPATTLASYCYSYMFAGCEKLTTAPELPATELEYACYSSMFVGCSKIKLSETQTAEYSIPYSVPSGGDGTTASYALDKMFRGTGGTFKGTPEINKTYYRPAVKYTVTWLNDDGTTIDTTSVYEGDAPTHADPTKAADGDHMYVFSGWTPELTAVTGDAEYTATFTETPITVDPVYLVTIPETVDLGANGTATMTITICGETSEDDVVLPNGKKVNVALTDSTNGFKLKSADGETIDYTVEGESSTVGLQNIADCTEGKASKEITFAKTGETKYSGTYTDRLTFTVSLVDA